ncbi:MAG TPA: hypothetical protein VNA89_07890 [Gemmatimonadaceae bacterium]|nr:hypothetical protein [Gemmatimonadaceae bacterium]
MYALGRFLVAPAVLAVALPVALPHLSRDARSPVEIREWTVPWEKSRPRDPYVDGQGRVWFVGQATNYIAYLDPASGRFERFEIDDGTHPHNLIVDRRGQVWYAGNRNGMIGRLDPATKQITRYPMPDAAVKDPHTLIFDNSGDIWFTAQQAGFVGKLETGSGQVRLIKVGENTRPYGIVVDSKNRPWFNEFGTDKIAMVDPATMKLREYKLPHERSRGRRIAITSDDRVWYVDYTRGFLARLDPASGQIKEYALPGGPQSLPYAMAVDDRDRLWFVETGKQPNRLVGFDPKTSEFFSTTDIAPSGGLTVRHMIFHAPTRALWFGTDANTIARASVP